MIHPYSEIARHYSVTLTFSPKGKMKRKIEEHDPLGYWNRRALCVNTRAFRAGAKQFVTGMELFDRVLLYNGKCWMCGAPWENIDHVKPLSIGGENFPCNLRPICKNCNNKKFNFWYGPLSPTEYAARILSRENYSARVKRLKCERNESQGGRRHIPTYRGGSSPHPIDPWVLDEIRTYYEEHNALPTLTWIHDIAKVRDGKGYRRDRARRALLAAFEGSMDIQESIKLKVARHPRKNTKGGSIPSIIPQSILDAISNYISETGHAPLAQWVRQLTKGTTGKGYRYDKAKRAIQIAQCGMEQTG